MSYKCIKCKNIFKKKELTTGQRLFYKCPTCHKETLVKASKGEIEITDNSIKLNGTTYGERYFNKYAKKVRFDKENNELVFELDLKRMLEQTRDLLKSKVFYDNCILPKVRFIINENNIISNEYNKIESEIFEMLRQGKRFSEIRDTLEIDEPRLILIIHQNNWEGLASLL